MEKKKRIISKLIFVLVLAAVVSMCFVGTTLARYVSSDSGTATTSVAKWDVDFGVQGSGTIEFGDLSPDSKEYSSVDSAENNRFHSTGKKHVATIANTGDVNANVTIAVGETITYTGTGSAFAGGSAWTSETVVTNESVPVKANVDKLFTIDLYYGTTNSAESATTEVTSAAIPVVATTGEIYVYAEVTWTSDDYDLETNADKLDTWVGENIETVSFALTFDAVQASELPDSST